MDNTLEILQGDTKVVYNYSARLTTYDPEQKTKIILWCYDNFDTDDWTLYFRDIYFKHEKDKQWFLLKWS